MTIDDAAYIGYISKTRGLKGEVQIFFEFEDYKDLEIDVVFAEVNKKLVPYFVEQIKVGNNRTAYAYFEDIDHIDKATILVRKKIYLPKDKLPVRDADDFRWSDLVGFVVVDEEEGELGEIINVQDMPQQTIATVVFEENELMFPLNEEIILGIDAESKVIHVDLPEGLVDVYRN